LNPDQPDLYGLSWTNTSRDISNSDVQARYWC
jgi:hypothetical protein